MVLLQQFEHIERLGQNGNQVQPFDLGLGIVISVCNFNSETARELEYLISGVAAHC